MSIKSLNRRLDKIPEPDLEQAPSEGYYEVFKEWPYEDRDELRALLVKRRELQRREEERQDRERRRQDKLQAVKKPLTDPAFINYLLQELRDDIAAKNAEAQRSDASLKSAAPKAPKPRKQPPPEAKDPSPSKSATKPRKGRD